jgi:hypothetical protein
MASLLAPGVKAPSYALVRPKSAPASALWAGANSPGANWSGVGGGWWAPPPSYKPPTINPGGVIQRTPAPVSGGNPGSAVANLGATLANTPTKSTPSPTNPTTYSATTATPAATPSPIDATYLQNVGANQATTANSIAALNRQQQNAAAQAAQSNYTDAVNNPELAHQYGTDLLAQEIAAQRRGALYSTGLAQGLTGVTQGYQDKYTAAQNAYQTLADQIAVQIAQANAGESQYEGGQLEDAVNRASALAQANPALGESAAALPNNAGLLARGATSPTYQLKRPAGVPAGALWAGAAKPGPNWRGVGGGWWVPTK